MIVCSKLSLGGSSLQKVLARYSVLAFVITYASFLFAQAALTVTPSTGAAGTAVTVQGSGFPPGAQIICKFDGVQVGTATADNQGQFTVAFPIPFQAKPGNYTVTCTAGELLARTNFLVTQIAPVSPQPSAKSPLIKSWEALPSWLKLLLIIFLIIIIIVIILLLLPEDVVAAILGTLLLLLRLLLSLLARLLGLIGRFFVWLWRLIWPFLVRFWRWLWPWIARAGAAIADFFVYLWRYFFPGLWRWLRHFVGRIPGWLRLGWNWLKQNWWEKVIKEWVIGGGIGALIAKLSGLWDWITGFSKTKVSCGAPAQTVKVGPLSYSVRKTGSDADLQKNIQQQIDEAEKGALAEVEAALLKKYDSFQCTPPCHLAQTKPKMKLVGNTQVKVVKGSLWSRLWGDQTYEATATADGTIEIECVL